MTSASMPSGQHRAIYESFVVSTGSQTTMKREDFATRPQTSAPTPSTQAAFAHPAPLSETTRSSSLNFSPVATQPIESDPQSVIFEPPNTVPEQPADIEPLPKVFGNRPLVKPVGDVSLKGNELVAFLFKATTRLSPAKCDGVRLKLQQLRDYVEAGRLSEPCLQKLNYLVDAIERSHFVDAMIYFEQLQNQFSAELGHWGQGVRLIVHELRGTRVGSAGSYIRNQ